MTSAGVEALVVEPLYLRPERHITLRCKEFVHGNGRRGERWHRSHASTRQYQSSKQGMPHARSVPSYHGLTCLPLFAPSQKIIPRYYRAISTVQVHKRAIDSSLLYGKSPPLLHQSLPKPRHSIQ